MTQTQADAAQIDEGLRKYMLGVYNYMALGVAFTGIVALFVATQPALLQAIALSPFRWVLFGGILLMGFVAPRIIMTGSMAVAHGSFWVYAALWGALMSPMFLVYTGDSMVRVFFITAAAFAGTSLYGYTTKRNLAPLGAFFMMATIGILVALLVNIFILQSELFHLGLSIVVVLVFAGLTAYETQMIKNMYYEGDGNEVATRKSIFGAFMLYGSFVTMFIWLLSIFGVARE
ncbi:Bax inhibitor-1/YccA family protein [Pelagibius sp.]|uniref:Bax inhibitor-1/YccA family protein n=1 Tax=Pelagibius sp. TaxID=1931238 RepID=UPI0026229523|nr:Bax inhibitor-1/YccA family protein [Pelagibius sp.]